MTANPDEHKRSNVSPNNGTVAGQWHPTNNPKPARKRLSVNHADSWLSRVRRRTYLDSDGKLCEAPEWSVRLRLQGRDVWFNLATANKEAAAARARDIYLFARANGVDAAVSQFKPGHASVPASNVTVGDWFRAVDSLALEEPGPKTLRSYKACLRTIVAGILHVHDDGARFDYRSEAPGVTKWRERVESTKLFRVTAEAVVRWQREFVAGAGKSPAKVASAKRTANSYVRQARCLFAKRLLKEIKIELPSPKPFEGVELFENGSTRYISKIDVRALIAAAQNELREADPEAYKAWLLAFFGGLRKAEADLLEWSRVDWPKGGVHIEETEWFDPKTHGSSGFVAFDPEVMDELKSTMASSAGDFVLSGEAPKERGELQYYRAEKTWQRLYTWLRSKGIKANKPVHELRKEAGSTLAKTKGIYAASTFLRHSDITTTARYYADKEQRLTTGLGPLLALPSLSENGEAAAG